MYIYIDHLTIRSTSGGTSFQEIRHVKSSVNVLHGDLITKLKLSPSSANIAEPCRFLVYDKNTSSLLVCVGKNSGCMHGLYTILGKL